MTDTTAAPRIVRSAEEMIGVLQLRTVMPVSLDATRQPKGVGEDTENIGIELNPRFTTNELRTGFRATHVGDLAVIKVAYDAVWTFDEPLELTTPALKDFCERVAFMSVYPFLREAIASMAARLRVAVPEMGIVKQGQFELTMTEEQAASLLERGKVESFDTEDDALELHDDAEDSATD